MLKRKLCSLFIYFSIFLSLTLTTSTTVNAAPSNSLGGLCQGSTIFSFSDTELDSFFNAAASTGALYFRIDVDWSFVQAGGSGSWNWSVPDRVINKALQKGFKVIALLTYAPSWANGGNPWNYPPVNTTYYGDFAYQAARHYLPMGVNIYELWNEPNVTWGTSANVKQYVNRVLKPGYNKIKQAGNELGKSSTVLTAGLAPAETNSVTISQYDFVQGIYANGGKNYFDALGNHPYCWPADPLIETQWNWFLKTQALYQIMNANGDGHKKIWATEVGWPTGNGTGAISESLQADYLTKAYDKWKTFSWAGPLLWYNFRNTGTNPSDTEQNFGLLRMDNTQKPAYTSFVNAMSQGAAGNKYEAENSALSGGAIMMTDHLGYSGSGFVSGYWTQGATSTFSINAQNAGLHSVQLKYANAMGTARTISIYVNGMKTKKTTLPSLVSWDTWGSKSEMLTLNAGNNTISYKYDSGDSGNVNLDYIEITLPTVFEAENSILSGGAAVMTDHSGYSGTGFVSGYWNQGAATAFSVNAEVAGNYEINLRYANAMGNVKTLSIYVNGIKIKQTSLPSHANWDTWGNKIETLYLNAGNNTITYKYDAGDSGNVNIDYISK